MARIPVLTKDQILAASFGLLEAQGIEGLTIRSIAKSLGKSTAPIYTQYENMEQIMDDLKIYAKQLMISYTKNTYAIDPFLNIGVGIIDYALNHTKAFSYYFLASDQAMFAYDQQRPEFLEQMKSNDMLTILGDERLLELLDDMWVYTYGLASGICTGSIPSKDLGFYIERLQKMGHHLISYHLYSTGSFEAYMNRFMAKVSKHISIEEVLKS